MKRAIGVVGDRLLGFVQSIRFRLTLWFVLILALVLATFSGFIYLTQTRDLRYDAVARMQGKFLQIQNYFRSAEWQLSDLSSNSVPGGGVPLQSGDLLYIVDANGSTLAHWGETIGDPHALVGALGITGAQGGAQGVYEQSVPIVGQGNRTTRSDYLFLITPILHDGHVLGYLVIGGQSDLISQERRLALSLGLGSLGMLAIAFLGGLWLADRAMRPVSEIGRTARSISESDLGRRLNMHGRNELAELAQTFDAMIARLQAAFDRQRRFVADASHELRTPLTIINLEVARALGARRSISEYQRALGVVDAESGRMTRLVNDLMTLARMDSGQTILKFEDLDLSDVALEAFDRLAPLAADRQVSLEAGDLPELRVRGDRQYLSQMVSNLIENGIKYCGAGAKVCMETAAVGDRAMLRVADTGPGIPKEHLPALFDRFYRADAARSQNGDGDSPDGSGLGLSIVAWIVRAHRGTIHVESHVGRGTTFEVSLPLI
jgi:signal transduction histidine kinase